MRSKDANCLEITEERHHDDKVVWHDEVFCTHCGDVFDVDFQCCPNCVTEVLDNEVDRRLFAVECIHDEELTLIGGV